jgi:hypothetical protein
MLMSKGFDFDNNLWIIIIAIVVIFFLFGDDKDDCDHKKDYC